MAAVFLSGISPFVEERVMLYNILVNLRKKRQYAHKIGPFLCRSWSE